MNKFESYACGQIFTSYPENMSFEEIIELCKDDEKRDAYNDSLEDTDNEDQQLHLCERYEHEWWDNVPFLLTEIADSVKRHFGDDK